MLATTTFLGSADGQLIVGRCGPGFGGELFAVDPDASSEPRLVAEGLGQRCALNGMVFGSDGLLYGAQPGDGRVVRLDVENGVAETFVELPVSGDNLVFGPDGVELFVTTGPNAGILAFDAVTGASRVVRRELLLTPG